MVRCSCVRATQDIVAILRLRPESEISTDSLLNNLKGIMVYPIDSDQVIRNLHHVRATDLLVG